ncbi:MAG: type II toxin-antitoxin system VapC family toxin, partial [Burkholderiaceae bacterium]
RESLQTLSGRYPKLGTAISRLSWLECRVGPTKNNDLTALGRYDAFFARADLVWIELDRDVVELAAAIRVRHGLRTPDALQAASCLQLGPEHVLLTGDTSFQKVDGLNATTLS